jgi:hypothetical protein
VRLSLLVLCAVTTLGLAACQPANPPPTPLPTKEKTIDKVKADIDKAMLKAQEIRDAADPETSPEKKGP